MQNDDRARVRKILSMSPDELNRFNQAKFMDTYFAELSADELKGLVVWIIRNKDYIGAWDSIPYRAADDAH